MGAIEYENDVAEPPEHLSGDFIQEAVENALRTTDIKIRKINCSMGSFTGENYCSKIYRCNVEYTLEDDNTPKMLPVIIKSMPHSKATEFLLDLQVYLKEKIFYSEVLPCLEVFLEKGQRFGARIYHSLKYPTKTLAFEDLKASHYVTASRETGLDETHCRLVMQRLAQFHATSMIFAEKDTEIMNAFKTGMLAKTALERENNMLLKFFGGNVLQLSKTISSWPGYEDITKKLERYVDNIQDNLHRCQLPVPGEIKVLNHGDLWVNNILFKYDQQHKPENVIFVDYQMCIWNSPGIDLNYFFYTSLQLDILKNRREALLQEYHQNLSATLRKWNYPTIPTYQQIQQEVRRRESFGFFANYGIFPTVSSDKETSSDSSLENFADPDFAKKKLVKLFAAKRLQDMFKYTLNQFDSLGIWD